jgi:16S rRNA (uracil1498-N3)-methyltransferase
MTTSFYAPPSAFRDAYVTLPDDEARHVGRALRKQPGDEIVVVDGVGGWHRVVLDHVDRRAAAGRVVETRHGIGEADYDLCIVLALLKNRNRYETLLEKAVELGVTEIVPLRTARTEKTSLKRRRAENILVAAMKQCGRSCLPHLAEPQSLDDLLARMSAEQLLLCHEQADASHTLAAALAAAPDASSWCVLVGPEGGFTEDEVEQTRTAGGTVVSLGPRRLRAETAAITAAAGVMLVAGRRNDGAGEAGD